jgi:hypothetical protein
MSDIEFIYNGESLIIQSRPEEIMKEISLKFAAKIGKDLTELLFLFKGNQLNMNSKLNEIQSNSEELKILVYDNGYTEKLLLKFNLTDKDNKLYYITLDLSLNFDIIVEYKDSFPNKIYKNSFTLNELKNKSKFFKMYDNVRECYEDINSLLGQKSFFIHKKDKSLILSIKKQLGINYDIDFPLKEEPLNINDIILELCEKYSILEKYNKELILKNENLEKKNADLILKNEDLGRNNNILISKYKILEKNYQELKEKNIIFEDKINELYTKNDNIEKKYNSLFENKRNIKIENLDNNIPNNLVSKFQFLFDDIVEDMHLIYNGLNRNNFFQNCEGKNNLLFLFKDKKGNEFGGYMSSKLLKNEKNKELIFEDKNSFIFNLQNKKKFMIIKENEAINIKDDYLISFGGNFMLGNDLYIKENKCGGMNRKDYYGDNYHETTNGQSYFDLSELKVYQLSFKK